MERKWWTLVAVCGGVFMLLLDITIVNVALPDIERELDASLSDLQWVIDAYALTLAALLLTAGSLADRFGRKLLFAIGIVIFTLGSLLCGVAGSPLVLTLSRAGQGIGGAIMFATALALLSNAFRGRDRGAAFGAFGATTGVAVAVGPVLGGALTSGLSWRWIFFVNLPVGIAALAVTLLHVEESRDPRPRPLDWIGFFTFSASLGLLVFGAHPQPRRGLGLAADRRLPGRVGRAAGGVRRRRVDAGEPDVRPHAAAQADLRRRPDRRLLGLGVDLLLLTYLVLYMQNLLGL